MQRLESSSSMSNSGSSSLRGIGLSNTIHSEVAPCLPLPSLPVFCGAYDQELRLFDEPRNARSLNRRDVISQASRIADLLRETDISYLNLRDDECSFPYGFVEPLVLYDEVVRCNPEAFEYITPVSQVISRSKSVAGQYQKRNPLSRIYPLQVKFKEMVAIIATSLIIFLMKNPLLLENQKSRRKEVMTSYHQLGQIPMIFKMPPLETFLRCWRTSVEEQKFLVMIVMKQSGYQCHLLILKFL